MSPWLLYLVALLYSSIAAQYVWNGRYGMAMAFVAYAIANLGLVWDLR